MAAVRYIMREFIYILIMMKHKIKSSKLIIQYRAKATYNSCFEGCNKLSPNSYFCGSLGFGSYIGENSVVIGKIGKYCSIGGNVVFITKTHPVKDNVSTHPAFYSLKKQSGFTYVHEQLFDEEPKLSNSRYSIEVGNDVYIGYGARIIGPCKIGDGVVIAAGAVVTHSVPDYAIVGGVPAKIIRYRFSDKDIEFLKSIRWWNMSQEWIMNNASCFNSIEDLKLVCKDREEQVCQK